MFVTRIDYTDRYAKYIIIYQTPLYGRRLIDLLRKQEGLLTQTAQRSACQT